MSESNKPKNNKLGTRSTDAQLQVYILRVIELLRENHTSPEICQIISNEFGKGRSQVGRYIQKAMEVIKKDFNRDAEVKRIEMIQSLRRDLKRAEKIFDSLENTDRQKGVWYKLILETKDRIARYTPETDSNTEDKTINVNYTVVGKDD